MKALRPHQTLALSMLRSSLAGGRRRPMLQAPTGFGKTLLSAAITDGARRKGNRVLFVVPALSLINQTVEAFAAEGIVEVGVIQGNHELTDWSMPVQVASVQTLERRMMPECDIAIVDEAHRWFKFYERWFAQADYPIIGLSATPWAKGLGKHYDDLLIAATTQELIDAGYLSRFKVYAPSHPDLSSVRTVAGDYHEGDLGAMMDKIPLVADIVTTWKRLGENRSTLCFAVNRAHAKNLQQQFEGAGVPTAYIDAYTTVEEREEIAEKFHAGAVRVVVNVGCLTTGVDWDVRCIILARPTKSEMLYTQIIGRGLRTAEGKEDCIILDHSDTTLRLGFVTDIAHEELDDGRAKTNSSQREKKEALPKECPKCTYLKPAKVHACPSCGFKPEKQSTIECEDGELLEITTRKRKPTPAEKRTFYAQLRGYALAYGKSEKWVLANFRSRFNEWPHTKNVPPESPGPEVHGWVKSRQIAYAHRKEAGNAAAAA
jgi:DNA repair protein RadD